MRGRYRSYEYDLLVKEHGGGIVHFVHRLTAEKFELVKKIVERGEHAQ